jgi:hypothetical protein
MMYLLTFDWAWLIESLLLGFGMGWIAVVQRGEGVPRRNLRWGVGALALLAGLAFTRAIPGRPGYWLDLALIMLVLYVSGCAVGSWLRDRVLARHAH